MSRLSRALRTAATLPARLYSAAQALREPTMPLAYHHEQTALLEERVRIAEDARAVAEANLERARRDRAADVGRLEAMVRAAGAHPENGRRLTCSRCQMQAINICTHIADAIHVAEERARDAERERDSIAVDLADLRAALDTTASDLREQREEGHELAAEVASHRARRAHLDAGPVVRRSSVAGPAVAK